jgi:ATP-dependent helicase/nuclease subunit A
VREAIASGDIVGSTRSRLQAGDVLVLVRQRGTLFEAIIRALKDANVPVAGADRLVLTEHIAVNDLLALADALLLPNDDLALAVALKSPLFGLDDDQLFALAWRRQGPLRAALRAKAQEESVFAEAWARLDLCSRNAHRAPFDFFSWLLGPQRGRARFYARLGHEAADALDEFLELALSYERRGPSSLQGFVSWLRAADTEIKRDMEITRNEVRVMTVHGAKGLEAPLVILADTTTRPTGARPPRLLAVPPAKAVPGTPDRLVWAARRDDDVAPVAAARQRALDEAEHEYRRLLYVAMTRAADRLIVCGSQGVQGIPAGCWYDLVKKGLEGKPGFSTIGEGDEQIGIYRRIASDAVVPPPPPSAAPEAIKAPSWLRQAAPAEPPPPTALTPSAALDAAAAARSLQSGRAEEHRNALARGRLVHRLLQSLPEIPPERRGRAAQVFLARSGPEFSAEQHARFIQEILAILDGARFAPLFSPGSRAELPIVGRLSRADGTPILVSGQIDRLAVTPEAVLIADYKTNRPAPRSLADVERSFQGYVAQLALYRAVLAKLYPDRPIRAALVWTDVPDLMELSADMLDHAVARLTSA